MRRRESSKEILSVCTFTLLAPQYTVSKSVGLASDSPMGLYFAAPSEMGTTLHTPLSPTDSLMRVQRTK